MYRIFAQIILFAALASALPASTVDVQPTQYSYAYMYQDLDGSIAVNTVSPVESTSTSKFLIIPSDVNLHVHSAALSPDRQWIAIIPASTGWAPIIEEVIHLIHVPTREVRKIPVSLGLLRRVPEFISGPLQNVGWSPDSHFLALISSHHISLRETISDVFLYSVSSYTLSNLTMNSAYESRIEWSDDSTQMAILSEECANYADCSAFIDTYDIATGIRTGHILRGGGGSALGSSGTCRIDWSPDLRFISFAELCDGSLFESPQEMYLLDSVKGTSEVITDYTTSVAVPEFAPARVVYGVYDPFWYDATTLLIGVLHQNEQQNGNITETIRYDVADGSTTLLLPTEMVSDWTVSPTSDELAFRTSINSQYENGAVHIGTYSDGTLTSLFTYQEGCDLEWSPDSTTLAYTIRGNPLTNCQHQIEAIAFVDRVTGQRSEYVLPVDSYAHPIGWIDVE